MYRVINDMKTSRSKDESWDEMRQYLQKKTTFGWKTIDEEEVPSYAWIQAGALGSTDWKSKFKDIPGVVFIK